VGATGLEFAAAAWFTIEHGRGQASPVFARRRPGWDCARGAVEGTPLEPLEPFGFRFRDGSAAAPPVWRFGRFGEAPSGWGWGGVGEALRVRGSRAAAAAARTNGACTAEAAVGGVAPPGA
jgi:hypothetical protein